MEPRSGRHAAVENQRPNAHQQSHGRSRYHRNCAICVSAWVGLSCLTAPGVERSGCEGNTRRTAAWKQAEIGVPLDRANRWREKAKIKASQKRNLQRSSARRQASVKTFARMVLVGFGGGLSAPPGPIRVIVAPGYVPLFLLPLLFLLSSFLLDPFDLPP